MIKYFIHDITLSLILNQSQKKKKKKLKNLIKISLIVEKKRLSVFWKLCQKRGEANTILPHLPEQTTIFHSAVHTAQIMERWFRSIVSEWVGETCTFLLLILMNKWWKLSSCYQYRFVQERRREEAKKWK